MPGKRKPVREHNGHVGGGAPDGRHSVVLEACEAVGDVLWAQPHVEGLGAKSAPSCLLALVQAPLQLLRVQARCILLPGLQHSLHAPAWCLVIRLHAEGGEHSSLHAMARSSEEALM